jgi:hypothetical protein
VWEEAFDTPEEISLMKRALFAGAIALSIAALTNPALAQGQGGVKTDSSAENPTTKTGGDTAKKDNSMTKSQGSGSATTGSAPRGSSMDPAKTGAGTAGKAMDDKQKTINSSGAGGGSGSN